MKKKMENSANLDFYFKKKKNKSLLKQRFNRVEKSIKECPQGYFVLSLLFQQLLLSVINSCDRVVPDNVN